MTRTERQTQLDTLTSAARETADTCGKVAELHRAGEMIEESQFAKLRERIDQHNDRLRHLLPNTGQLEILAPTPELYRAIALSQRVQLHAGERGR